MFRHLLINTIASAAAYGAVSIVGFLLVPVLVGHYGLKEFGFIVLARLFLPTGVLILFDFGFSEIASQSVARARETRDWDEAAADLQILLAMALAVSAALALCLIAGAAPLARLFAAGEGSFAAILRATGVALPPLFLAAILEGVVKGYAAFRSLRLIEVACTCLYGLAALLLASNGHPYGSIAYAFLATTILRGALVAANAVRAGFGRELKLRTRWDRRAVRRILPRCTSMAQNRLIGVLQGPGQQPLIGLLVGPAGVAMVEVLTKLPRFAKAVIGLLGSALIPVAARLDARNDAERVEALASWGMLLAALAALPPLFGAALFSEPLLYLWTGPTFAAFWHWHALMFVLPLATALAGFGSTALIVRPYALYKVNAIAALQLAGQLALAFALLGRLQERAFLLAQALGVLVALVFTLRLLMREHSLAAGLLGRIAAIVGLGVALAIASLLVGDPRAIRGWATLASAHLSFCLLYWLAAWYLVLQRCERERLQGMIASLLLRAAVRRSVGT
jgi:O-antigen/teichoic acid export membrane protein